MKQDFSSTADFDALLTEMTPPIHAAYERWRQECRAEAGRLSSRGMEKKAATGTLPGCAPVGYRNVGKGIEIDPVLGPIVRESFERAASSELPLRALLAEMTEKGLVSRNGNPMNVSAFWYMLRNQFYIGMVNWKEALIRGVHEPLVGNDLFEAAHQRHRNTTS